MNNYILKSIREEKGSISRPTIRRPGKKKSCFIDHNDYVVERSSTNLSDNVSVNNKINSQSKD